MTLSKRRLLLCALAAFAAAGARAEFPSKPLRIVVQYQAGGSSDILARLVAEGLSKRLGQPVVVDNRAGAAGIVGVQALRQAAPDGYTLMMGNIGPNAINYGLYKQLPYRAEDFAPITMVVSVPNVLVVNAKVPARNVAELVALAKSQPGKLSFASSGTGQSVHLSGELFKKRTGIDIIHVPYKGAAPAVADLVAGQLNMNRRLLHRRLAEEGLTFTGILEDVRSGIVTRALSNTDRPLSALADMAGFSSLSAFSRWFRDRFGAAPSSWRSNERAQLQGRAGRY